MKLSCGITTVPARATTLLPHTIESLKNGGFESPLIFVDEEMLGIIWNWVRAAWTMYAKEPQADRYVVFQDDISAVKNLREFLERCQFPDKGYLNLMTFPTNELPHTGWYEAPKLGKGATGLVFDNEGLRKVLTARHMIDKPRAARHPKQNADGAIYYSMLEAGYKEYVHMPSLIQHTGIHNVSTMPPPHNQNFPLSSTFPGEEFDALTLL